MLVHLYQLVSYLARISAVLLRVCGREKTDMPPTSSRGVLRSNSSPDLGQSVLCVLVFVDDFDQTWF